MIIRNIKIFVFLSCLTPALSERQLELFEQGKSKILNRMMQLLRTYYVKMEERMTGLNNLRFGIAGGKEFEEGYLMATIIERYKKCVEHTKISEQMKAFKVNDVLLRLEMVQRMYLDIYRLVNMMHEIPRKYGIDERKKRPIVKGNPEELEIAIKSLKTKDINRKKQRRQRLKELKKMREEMQKAGDNLTMTPRPPRNKKQWWEFQEYGWEVAEDYMPDW